MCLASRVTSSQQQQDVPDGGIIKYTTLVLRGLRLVLASISKETGETELVAMSWLDRNRCHFIMTMCGIGEGEEINPKQLRQLDRDKLADPDMVIIRVAQPRAIATEQLRKLGNL